MSEDMVDEAQIRQYLEGLIAVLQVFRDQAPRVSVAQIQAILATAVDTMELQNGDRLPVVGDYARRLGLSPSGASRLMKQLSEEGVDGAVPLIESDAGSPGSRSGAFVLSEQGRTIIAKALEALTGRRVGRITTHDFLTFAFARYGKKEAGPLAVKVLGPRTIFVGPRRDAISQEVRAWCLEQLSEMPEVIMFDEGVKLVFATENDAFFFRMRW